MIKTENITKYALPAVAVTGLTVGSIVLFSNRTGKKILKEAKKYIGIKEIHPNKGWQNKYFQSLMKKVGWQSGWDYCVLFTKLVLSKTLKGKKRSAVAKLFNASSQTTWQNLQKYKHLGLYEISKKAKPGSIAFYKHMQKNWRGHADILIRADKDTFTVVSANGSVGVEVKTRKYAFTSNSFRLLGFVNF